MRLIFYRTGAIGDIIHCLPALKFIKEKYPEASIELVSHCEPLKKVLKYYAPYIDKIFITSKKDPVSKELLKSLKEEPCNTFTYLHSNWLKAIYLNIKFFKAKLNIYKKDLDLSSRENFLTAFDPSLKTLLLNERYDNSLLNSLLDYDCLKFSPNLDLEHHRGDESAEIGIWQECENAQKILNGVKPYIVIIPGVGKLRPQRAFPLERWEDFIRKLIENTNLDIKILGGPDEADLSLKLNVSLKLRSPTNTRIENLIGKLNLLESTQILESATKVYACDTGLLHIASALGKDIETIYSVTSEFRTGPYSPRAKIFRSKFCKCQNLKNFHDNKISCEYLASNGLPRCTQDLGFSC
jgi:ADP-heptose:LPS heptosyltransferase